MRAVLRPLAVTDIEDAAQYYEAAEAGLGGRVLDAVDAALRHIEHNPKAGSSRYEHVIAGVRMMRTETFPYLLFYLVHDDLIDVLRVLHMKRDLAQLLDGEEQKKPSNKGGQGS